MSLRNQRAQRRDIIRNMVDGGQDPNALAAAVGTQQMIQNLIDRIAELERKDSKDETFVSNPYQANINPSTSNGLKMYQMATTKRDPLLNPRIKSKKEFMDAMASDSVSFGWGKLINNVKVGDQTFSILKDVQKLNLDKVRSFTSQYLYQANSDVVPPADHNMVMFDIDPENVETDKIIFYARVRMNMIGTRIWNSLNSAAQTSLQPNLKKFIWKQTTGEQMYDGPTMLQLIVETINPSTMVGVTTLKDKIRAVTLPGHNHNVVDMLNHQNRIYQEILQLGNTHDDIIYDTFKALASTTNDEFESYVKTLKSAWETQSGDGKELTHDALISKCIAKYNNLVDQKTWNDGQNKSAKLVALATQVKSLEQKLASHSNGGRGAGNGNPNKNGKGFQIPEWRKTKSLGDEVQKDGKDWHWCPHQHNNGKGMYVNHKPEDHTHWQERQKKSRKNGSRGGQKDDSTTNNLQLDDKIKAAMVTKFKCSESDAAELLKSVSKAGN